MDNSSSFTIDWSNGLVPTHLPTIPPGGMIPVANPDKYVDFSDLWDDFIKRGDKDNKKDKNEITDPMFEGAGCQHTWMLYKGLNLPQKEWVYVCDKCGKENPYKP